MNHLATRLLGVALMLVASMALVGCDDEITSVEDIEFQTLVNVPSNEITITGGQPENPAQFEISYQGLDARPSVSTGSESLNAEVVEETGSPDAGTTTWRITYLGSIEGPSLEDAMTITIQSEGESFQEEVAVQVNSPLSVAQEAFTFVAGQSPLPRIRVTYEGLGQAPELTSGSSAINIELANESGDSVAGERAWVLEYTEPIEGDSVTETVQLTASGSEGATYTRALSVQFNNAISTTTDFTTEYIVVEDFETGFSLPEITTEGSTSATVQTGEASPNSTGRNALEVQATGGDPVTLIRRASALDLNTLSFLIKPDATNDLNLTITLTEQVDGESVSRDVGLLIEASSEWVRYDVALDALLEEFNPVAERDGGNGPLESISFTSEEDATYLIDDVMMGTPDRRVLEINDFEITNNPYGSFSDITLGFSEMVPEGSTGFTSRSFSYVEGGSFFGYNFNSNGTDLFLSNAANGDIVVRIGAVSQGFDLFAFVESPEGGYTFDAATTVPVEAGDEWREVRIPLSDLGNDPSALFNPGIGNVGFEIRGAGDADEDNPVEFLIDKIVLDAQGE